MKSKFFSVVFFSFLLTSLIDWTSPSAWAMFGRLSSFVRPSSVKSAQRISSLSNRAARSFSFSSISDQIHADYLKIMKEKGRRPRIQDLKSKFENQLTHYVNPETSGKLTVWSPTPSEELIKKNLVSKVFPLVESHQIELRKANTPSGSSASVFMIQDLSLNSSLGVLKIQKGNSGFVEIISLLVSESQIQKKAPHLGVSKTIAFGKFGHDDYFVIQSKAVGKDLETFLNQELLDAQWGQEVIDLTKPIQVVESVAEFYADFHSSMSIDSEHDTESIRKFQENMKYEFDAFRKHILDKKPNGVGVLYTSLQRGEMGEDEFEKLHLKLTRLRKSYISLVKKYPHLLFQTNVQGDAHGGNIIIDDSGDKTMIDYANLIYSLNHSNQRGLGDSADDVGRMMGYVQAESLKNGQSIAVAKKLAEVYFDAYQRRRFIGTQEREALEVAAHFYRFRYLAKQLGDIEGIKFKSHHPDLCNLELRQRLIQLMDETLN